MSCSRKARPRSRRKSPAYPSLAAASRPNPERKAGQMAAKIEKVSIIISKGSLEGIYPGLIMANGARAEGVEANLFFTFFGLDAVHRARHEHIKLATVDNPGLH